MSAKRFLLRVFLTSVMITGGLVAINWWIDLYGLFRDHKAPNGDYEGISIYSDERTSKFLLAHRYVPDFFEGYIIGPSLSANVDPSSIDNHAIYNLSMMGANITEEAAVVRKAMERRTPELVVICVHPYLTLDHGMKTGMINEREYYGALGSVSLYKAYLLWGIRKFNLAPSKYPKDQFSIYGYNDYGVTLVKMPVEDKIAEQLTRDDAVKTDIDPVAFEDFKSLVNELNEKNVKVIAYFHPLPYPIYDKFRAPLDEYKKTMSDFLNGKAEIIDFTNDEAFTKDLTNYIDHGHLSDKGQTHLIQVLANHLNLEPPHLLTSSPPHLLISSPPHLLISSPPHLFSCRPNFPPSSLSRNRTRALL